LIPSLAYIPFITPIHALLSWWYLLLIPLAFGISVIYKALRVGDLSRFWPQVFVMTVQIVVGMIALAAALMFLVLWLVPRLPVE
jgi:hypothetical protein